MHILIVEDDRRIAENIRKILASLRYTATITATCAEAMYQLDIESYDLVILDWMLPDKSGLEVCKYIRKKENATPIIMLTAKSQLEDKIEGLNCGADDYLTKPFAMKELLARIKAQLRRKSGPILAPVIQIADMVINTNSFEVMRKNRRISLAPKEYALLEYLIRNKCRVIDRMTLLHHVWGEEIDQFSNTIDVHIRYLRKKIDEGFTKKLIKTVKNKGYMLCEN